jgi:hypothetical protein
MLMYILLLTQHDSSEYITLLHRQNPTPFSGDRSDRIAIIGLNRGESGGAYSNQPVRAPSKVKDRLCISVNARNQTIRNAVLDCLPLFTIL